MKLDVDSNVLLASQLNDAVGLGPARLGLGTTRSSARAFSDYTASLQDVNAMPPNTSPKPNINWLVLTGGNARGNQNARGAYHLLRAN
jgi:hypothetical protein